MHGSVGGSDQRLLTSLVGEDTQCKPLEVDLRYYKTGYTEGNVRFCSVARTCPRTCCILDGLCTRPSSAAGVLDRLSSRIVESRTSPATSGLDLPWSRAFLGQVPQGGEVVVPTSFRLARKAKPRVCIPECNTICAFQHATAVFPPSMVVRVPQSVRSCPPDRQ